MVSPGSNVALRERLANRLEKLETRIADTLNAADENEFGREDYENFYRLPGCVCGTCTSRWHVGQNHLPQWGIITEDLLRHEMQQNHLRHDAFDVLERMASLPDALSSSQSNY